ncbi:MAG: pitrilysin family protein [Planctomycetota bacterium]
MTSTQDWTEPLVRGGCRFSETRLPNGMRVLVGERHTDPVVAAMVFYGVGSVHEAPEVAGVSHFLEHMMFKGTERRGKGEVDRATALLGGRNNAFTGKDHTGYWFEFASDRWEEALAIEADRMTSLAIDAEELEAEREVVLEELAMGLDDPWTVLSQEVESAACGGHAYGRPIIGTQESVAGITREAMEAHYRRAYAPENATVVVCGDVERDEVLSRVRAAFPAAPRGVAPLPEPAPLVNPEHGARVRTTWPDEGRRLCIAWPGSRCGEKDDTALDFVQTVLTSGRNSVLQRALVLDGELATSVSTANDARAHGGLFWLFAEAADGVGEEQLESAIAREIARLATDGPTEKEMQRALGILVAGDAFEAEGVSEVAEQIGSFALDADWRLALDDGATHRSVTADDVRDAVRRLLTTERATVGWCVPEAGTK